MLPRREEPPPGRPPAHRPTRRRSAAPAHPPKPGDNDRRPLARLLASQPPHSSGLPHLNSANASSRWALKRPPPRGMSGKKRGLEGLERRGRWGGGVGGAPAAGGLLRSAGASEGRTAVAVEGLAER